MSEAASPDGLPLEQQLEYARDLRRIYDAERARRADLQRANSELAQTNAELARANAELDRRLYDLLAAQDWILAVNSSRELPLSNRSASLRCKDQRWRRDFRQGKRSAPPFERAAEGLPSRP